MTTDEKYYRQPWMTDAQWAAADCIASVFGGHNHIKAPKPCGDGILVALYERELSTFDFSHLTALVLVAHDRAVRISVIAAGRTLALKAYFRGKREGRMTERHPTIEEAIATLLPRPSGTSAQPARTEGGST